LIGCIVYCLYQRLFCIFLFFICFFALIDDVDEAATATAINTAKSLKRRRRLVGVDDDDGN